MQSVVDVRKSCLILISHEKGRWLVLYAGVDVVTLGQYMRPTKRHMPVVDFVTPEAFSGYESAAKNMGFMYAAAGPMVRSSYRAGEFYLSSVLRRDSQDEAASG